MPTAPSPFPPSCRSPAVLQTLHSVSDKFSDALQQLEIAPLSAPQSPCDSAASPQCSRDAGADSTAEAATLADVVITSAMIEALRGLPAATRTVGVSATSFKRACRRLEIRRWGYRRGPGRRRGQGASDSPPLA